MSLAFYKQNVSWKLRYLFLKKGELLLLNYSICTVPDLVTIKSSPDIVRELYHNHWYHIRVESTERWKSKWKVQSWEHCHPWAFEVKGNPVYKYNICQRYKIMQYRPHLLCKIYIVLASKLEKIVMVKFCSAMTLTSVKVSKEHVHLGVSRID